MKVQLMPTSKNRRKGKKRQSPTTKNTPLSAPSQATMEAMMSELQSLLQEEGVNDLATPEGDRALFEAQDLVYDAWEAGSKRERMALAKQALEISRDCADAWCLLAEEAKGLVETRAHLEEGVAAGERALGKQVFEEDVGHFWGLFETRPYMRARASLADCLWEMGEKEEAVDHMVGLLRLNPNDNQGIRSILTPRLLWLDRLSEAEKLLSDYEEDMFAQWCFDQALLLYLKEGSDAAEAKTAMQKALKTNPYVADYLLENKKLPKSIPNGYTLNSKEEAYFYVLYAAETWKAKKGALIWLHENAKLTK